MEWQQLIYFQCVARTEHIGKASAELHVTQPAISMSIKKLEAELGVPLFDRHKKNITLNKYGRIFQSCVENVSNELSHGIAEIQRLHEVDANRVTVMIPSNLLHKEVMDKICQESPNILLENKMISYESTAEDLKNGKLDFCVLSPPINDSEYVSIPIEVQSMYIITSETHHLSKIDECHLIDLADENFISYSENSSPRQHFESLCKKAGFTPKVTFECNSIRTAIPPVQSGRCIALVAAPAFYYYNIKNNLHVIKLLDKDINTILSLSYHKSSADNPLVQQIINIFLNFYPPIKVN